MSKPVGATIKAETRISVIINMALSATFFLGGFGLTQRPLAMGSPDNLGLDFIPQSIAIGFFSALVPVLIVSSRRRKGLIVGLNGDAVPTKVTLLRALGFMVAAGLVGAIIAGGLPIVITEIAYFQALVVKLTYGGLLAFLVTPRALRLAL